MLLLMCEHEHSADAEFADAESELNPESTIIVNHEETSLIFFEDADSSLSALAKRLESYATLSFREYMFLLVLPKK